jgi:FSR family fosmidomycin resistance protein-like MFS transporter
MTAVAAGSEVRARRSFSEVWVITIGHSLTHWYPATFYLLMPLIGRELGLSYSELGSILTAQAVAGAISNIPGGIIVDSVGRKGLLMALSLFWIGFPYVLMGVSHAYWMFLACAVLIGIGNNLWHPAAIPMLARRFPERKGLVVSIHGMGGNVGDAVAPFVAGLLLQIFSWRQVVIMNVIPGIFMSLAILIYLGRLQMDAGGKKADEAQLGIAGTTRAFAMLLKNRTLMMLSVSSAFRAMTQNSLLAFLPLYLANQLGYNAALVGTCMLMLQAAGFVASPVAGALSDRMGRRNIITSSMVMTGVVLAAMALSGGTELFVFLIAVLGFFLFAVRPVLQAWTLDATPKNLGGSAIGMLFAIQAAGSAVGPIVCGLLADKYGLMSTFYFMAATIVVANMFVFTIPRDGKSDYAS